MTAPKGPRSFLAMMRYLRAPYDSTLRTFEKWGDPVSVYGPDGPIVLTANPEHVKTLLAIDPELVEPYAVEQMAPVIGPESLMMLGGERHRNARKLLQPPFHGARMRAYARIMHDIAVDDMQQWPAHQPFAIQERT